MLMMMDALHKQTNVQYTGYFDTGFQGMIPELGFRLYLEDQGYDKIKIYIPARDLTAQERRNYKNFQSEYGSAIGSIKYYPRGDQNDGIRSAYTNAHSINQDFKFPEIHEY